VRGKKMRKTKGRKMMRRRKRRRRKRRRRRRPDTSPCLAMRPIRQIFTPPLLVEQPPLPPSWLRTRPGLT